MACRPPAVAVPLRTLLCCAPRTRVSVLERATREIDVAVSATLAANAQDQDQIVLVFVLGSVLI